MSAEALFQSISHIGGDRVGFIQHRSGASEGSSIGWSVGRVTSRRRSPTQLRINDVVDFWRVENKSAQMAALTGRDEITRFGLVSI